MSAGRGIKGMGARECFWGLISLFDAYDKTIIESMIWIEYFLFVTHLPSAAYSDPGIFWGMFPHRMFSSVEFETPESFIFPFLFASSPTDPDLMSQTLHHGPWRGRCWNGAFINYRIKNVGLRVDVKVHAHRMWPTCATQLLNAGRRTISIQKFLSH